MDGRHRIGALAVVAVGAAAVFCLWNLRTPAEKKPPNVLIVLWDTVRADHLSLYGHEQPTSPFLERFAEQAVVYDHVFSPAMWTVPSHGSMFTGQAPSSHGANADWRWLDGHHTTMAEWFAEHGYATFAFSSNPNLSGRGANLLQGFDEIHTSWSARWWPLVRKTAEHKLLPADASTEISPAFRGTRAGNAYYNGALATERAVQTWLDERDPEQPFFAYLNYMEAHKPRIPAQRFRDAVIPAELQTVALATDVSMEQQIGYSFGGRSYTDLELDAARAVYDAALRELDFFFGRLVVTLEERGLLDDTIVVVTSDHGESLGEHRQFGHRDGVYQTLLHVPLVIRYPHKLRPARVRHPVTTLDLFATLTELADLPMVDGTLSRSLLDGSVREALFAEVTSYDHTGLKLARNLFPGIGDDHRPHTYRTVRRGPHKLVVEEPDHHTELYDLERDPHELQPLEDPVLEAALEEAMRTWWAALPPYDASRRGLDDVPKPSDHDRAMLEQLGYVSQEE